MSAAQSSEAPAMSSSSSPPGFDPLLSQFPDPPSNVTLKPIYMPFDSRPVLLLVGRYEYPFYVHEHLLTAISPFFRAALDTRSPRNAVQSASESGGFLESRTRTIKLPEEIPEDMKYFLQWLYTTHSAGRLYAPATNPKTNIFVSDHITGARCPTIYGMATAEQALWHPKIDPFLPSFTKQDGQQPAFGPLIRLYFLSDRLCIPDSPGMRDQIIDRILQVSVQANAFPGAHDIKKLWEDTRAEENFLKNKNGTINMGGRRNRLRQLCLDLFREMKAWQVFSKGLLDSGDIAVVDEIDDGEGEGEGDIQQRQMKRPILNANPNAGGTSSGTQSITDNFLINSANVAPRYQYSNSIWSKSPAKASPEPQTGSSQQIPTGSDKHNTDSNSENYPRAFLADLLLDYIRSPTNPIKERQAQHAHALRQRRKRQSSTPVSTAATIAALVAATDPSTAAGELERELRAEMAANDAAFAGGTQGWRLTLAREGTGCWYHEHAHKSEKDIQREIDQTSD